MEATLAGTLLTGFEDWLKKTEEAGERKIENPGDQGLRDITVNGLFTQMGLIIQCVQDDPESWREIAEFIQNQEGRYKFSSVNGCLDVMRTISQVFLADR